MPLHGIVPSPLVNTTLVFLIASTAFAIDISLPAIPAVADATGATLAQAQRTIGIFVLGYALGQIPMGLLADRFGRRPVLLLGMTAFGAFGLATSLTQDMQSLLILRFFQGATAATGAVLARAIARDITEGADTARLLTFLASSMGFAMVAAPIMGSIFLAWMGWRGPFVGSAMWGAIGLAMSVFLIPETRPGPPATSTLHTLWRGLTEFARTPRAWFGAAMAGLAFCGIMSLVTLSPAVFMENQGLGPAGFALCFGLIAMGYVVGSLILRAFTGRFTVVQLLARTGIGFAAASVLCALAAGWANLPWTVALLAPVMGLYGANLGLANALALQPLGHVAGVAAGLTGTLQLLIGGSYSIISTSVGITDLTSLLTVFAVVSGMIVALTIVLIMVARD